VAECQCEEKITGSAAGINNYFRQVQLARILAISGAAPEDVVEAMDERVPDAAVPASQPQPQ
jgi:hypothetical protein